MHTAPAVGKRMIGASSGMCGSARLHVRRLHRGAPRAAVLAVVALLAPVLLVLAAAMPGAREAALAAPSPPPGGNIPVYFGGNNRAGYPPLNTVSVTPQKAVPPAPGLALRAAPNPFTRGVILSFSAAASERSTVRIFSRDGRLVRQLGAMPSGENAWRTAWDGRDDRGRSVAPGLYIARVEAGGRAGTLRIVRLK